MLWFKFLFSFLTKCDLSRLALIIVMALKCKTQENIKQAGNTSESPLLSFFLIYKLDFNDIRQTLTKGEATKYLVTPVAISLGVAGKGVYFSFPDFITASRDTLQEQDQEKDIYVPLARLKKTVNKNNVNKSKQTFKGQIIQLLVTSGKRSH